MRRRELRLESCLNRLGVRVGLGGFVRPPGSLATGPVYWFNPDPAYGSDSNNGLTRNTPFRTWSKLSTLVASLAVNRNWLNPLASIPTYVSRLAWYAAIAGQGMSGVTIAIDTSTAYMPMTGLIALPGPGHEIISANAAQADLRINVALSDTFTQPVSNCWQSGTAVYLDTIPYEFVGGDWVAMDPISVNTVVTVVATAKAAVAAAAGSFWTDPATGFLYLHPRGGGNPNSDGVVRQYVPAWACTVQGRAIELGGGRAYRLKIDGGAGYDFSAGTPNGLAGVGCGEHGQINVVDGCTLTRNGKHSVSFTGNLLTGFNVCRNTTCKQGPGSGISFANWSHGVSFTSGSGTGTIDEIWDNFQTVNGVQNTGTSGGNDTGTANGPYQAYLTHAGTGRPFRNRRFVNCTLNGTLSASDGSCSNVEIVNSDLFGGLACDADTLTAQAGPNRNTIGFRLPALGTTLATQVGTFGSYDFRPGTYFTGSQPGLAGTYTLSGCNLYLAAGNFYSSMWARSGTYSLTISGVSTITQWYASNYGLLDAFTVATDALSISGASLVVAPVWNLIVNYNATGSPELWSSNNHVSGSTFQQISAVSAGVSLLYQDAGLTIPAVLDGDPVAVALDSRDTVSRGYMYYALTNATLKIANGLKAIQGNGTSTTCDLKAGNQSADVGLGNSDFSFFAAVELTASPASYAPVATSDLSAGGFRMFLKLAGTNWGTFGSPSGDYPSGTALANASKHVLGMVVSANPSGTFYSDGANDGSFQTSGSGASANWTLNIFHENTANRFGNLKISAWGLWASALNPSAASAVSSAMASTH